MLINADLVLRTDGTAILYANGRIMVSAYYLLPGSRVYLLNSRNVVCVTKNEGGFTEAVREADGHACLLDRLELYEVVSQVPE